jgi:hypothetical protein
LLTVSMIGPSALLKPVTALVAVGLLVVFLTEGEAPVPAKTRLVQPRLRVDATSDAEARQMRRATLRLARELGAATRCDVRRSAREMQTCVSPALQHVGVGGRGASILLGTIAATVPSGRCLAYLVGLAAANSAAGDNARWLLMNLYRYMPRDRRRALVGQINLAYSMLRRASRAAAPDVCEPGAGQPAA